MDKSNLLDIDPDERGCQALANSNIVYDEKNQKSQMKHVQIQYPASSIKKRHGNVLFEIPKKNPAMRVNRNVNKGIFKGLSMNNSPVKQSAVKSGMLEQLKRNTSNPDLDDNDHNSAGCNKTDGGPFNKLSTKKFIPSLENLNYADVKTNIMAANHQSRLNIPFYKMINNY